jgi:pimeloyl-ACP methyl ester carboxylesterase/tetratricopeptide (TPR) repeat protein
MAEASQRKGAQTLRIPGIAAPEPKESLARLHAIKVKESRSFIVSARREGAAPAAEIVTDPDEVVEIELEDGSRFWTSRQRLCDEVLRDTAQRGADGAVTLSSSLPLRSPSRGIVGSLLIKTLRFFKIDVPEMAARKISKVLEDRTLDHGTNLFQCSVSPTFSLSDPGTIPTDRAILLFLHGTASSTEGSFGEFWQNERRTLRETLFAPYQGHVYAFEHRTLTESPLTNVIALVKKLPAGARLHLIAHSRGGLVGEILNRANMADNRDPFDSHDLDFFKKNDRQAQRGNLTELNRLLKTKKLRVERFVRVGCPTRGTSLASDRFDLYLSIIFNLIQKIPVLQASVIGTAYDIFSELIMAIAKERSDPNVLPGIEAMIPTSPLISLLNRPGRAVGGELRVIAGDTEGENLAAALGTLLTDPIYLGDNDLVVDTAAMFGGAERRDSAGYSMHQGSQVSHFRYFRNEDSLARVVKAITRKPDEKDGFENFSVRSVDAGVPPYKRDEERPQPVVFLLPGIMGSHLAIGDNRIWIDPVDLAFGGLSQLNIKAEGVRAEAPVSMAYGEFVKFLAHSHEVVPFPYDWRISLLTEANRLAEAVESKLDEAEPRNHPVSIIAHSMGGLLARAMIATHPETWARLCRHPDARVLMLGTPNGGSYIVPLVFTGRESMVKQLAMVDFTNNQAELLEILRSYPGLMQMLPVTETDSDFFSAETWRRLRGVDDKKREWIAPDASLLEMARVFRNLIDSKPTIVPDRMCYIAGIAPATPAALEIVKDEQGNEQIVAQASPEGDGRVLWSTGRLAGIKTWYVQALHGDLADHEPAFAAIRELLEKGTTDKLPVVPPVARGVPARFVLAEEKTPLYPDEDSLIRSALGKARKTRSKPDDHRAKVRIVHGNLAFASNPVMVGHYEGDSIISAEAHLDRALDGRLRDRLLLGLYPGPQDTEVVFLDAASAHAGAIVIGLGAVGTLSPGGLARAVSRGARAYAVACAERSPAKNNGSLPRRSANISALLIGTGAGGFSIENSVAAILRGIAHASQNLRSTAHKDKIRIDEVEFIELYEDRAIQAAHALQRVKEDAELSRRFEIDRMPVVVTRRGSRRRASFAEEAGWWQRLQITEDQQDRLVFHLLTDRARTQAYLQSTQRLLVEQFIKGAIETTATDEGISVTLFEMLIPNELKDRAPEQRDVVLVVNDAAARYPWELMQERRPGQSADSSVTEKPLSVQAGMLRQLQSIEFRERVVMAQGRSALVVGDPPSRFVPLDGAVQEARTVAQRLAENNFEVVSSIRSESNPAKEVATEVLTRLHERDYRIVHLAGHGVYDYLVEIDKSGERRGSESSPRRISGMVIGTDNFLTPAEIGQMRAVPDLVFINCCHLGRIEDLGDRPDANFPRLAANLATELIRMGVRAVVAAGWAVDDQAAQTFADIFYRELLAGVAFGRAVHRARTETFELYPGVNTWGAYQCYGDPAFTLTQQVGAENFNHRELHFASPSEVIVELENIAEDAATATETQLVRLRERVDAAIDGLPSDWLARADVQAATGRAFGELGMFVEAIEHYEIAMQADIGEVPVNAVEQLCNLMVRQAGSMSDSQKAKEIIVKARARLTALMIAVGPSVERWCLLGSIAKREAGLARQRRQKEHALADMRDAYKKAHELETNAGEQADPYPLLNWLTAEILLELLGKKGEAAEMVKEKLAQAESAAMERDRRNPSFWALVAAVDSMLLRYLANGNLRDHIEELVNAYIAARKRDGSPRELLSVAEQLEFLSGGLAFVREPAKKKRLQTALGKIRHGLIKSTQTSS